MRVKLRNRRKDRRVYKKTASKINTKNFMSSARGGQCF